MNNELDFNKSGRVTDIRSSVKDKVGLSSGETVDSELDFWYFF